VRKSAIFSLSQRPKDESVPALIRIARTHRDPELRRNAIFWLGQSRDDRAIRYFEEVLLNDR
jgi:HEAT repeat protein